MTTPRTPLGLISSNRQIGIKLSPYERGAIVGAKSLGYSAGVIANRFRILKSTVCDTICLNQLRANGASLARSGRPKAYSERDERILVQYMQLYSEEIYREVKLAIGLDFSDCTMKCILAKYHITNWRAKQRPALTEAHVQKRLAWCKAREHYTIEDWRNIM